MQNFLSDLYYRVKFGIRIHRNVLTEEERLTLLEESKKHLTFNPDNPGLQTSGYLHNQLNYHNYLTLIKLLNKIGFKSIDRCWSNYSDSEYSETLWHTHPIKMTSIYYMENPEELGTLFRVNNKVFQINVPTNTLMVIPGNIEHNAPSNMTKPRQCFVIDTNE